LKLPKLLHPNRRTPVRILGLSLWLVLGSLALAQGRTDMRVVEQEQRRGIVELYEALTPLRSVTSFMTIGAHPDDERSNLIAWLSRGQGVRAVTVTANRGEGGQNSIGTEYRQALGVLRSREMEASSKAFNVELFFLSESFDDPIYDESFSKSAVETLELWGEDALMEKLVRAVRESRPDIVFSNFQNVYGQHGHHRAMALATERVYELAGDPTAFPEHFEQGLRPWEPRKFYLPAGRGSSQSEIELPATLSIETGDYDPLFGATYAQLGQQSRAYHRSQDMGSWRDEGSEVSNLHLAASRVSDPDTEDSLFEGLPQTVADLGGMVEDEALQGQLRGAQAAIDRALGAYPDFAAVHEAVREALTEVRAARETLAGLGLDEETAYDLDFRLALKEAELQYASRSALSLVSRVTLANAELTRGGSTEVVFSAYLGGQTPVENVAFEIIAPEGWTVERLEDAAEEAEGAGQSLGYGETLSATYTVTVPEDAELFNPYRRNVHPFEANNVLYGVLRYEVDGVAFESTVDPSGMVAVLPDVSLRVTPGALVHNLLRPEQPITLSVAATSYVDGPVTTTLVVDAPEGWAAEPASVDVSFSGKGDARGVNFTLIPPEGVGEGSFDFTVRAEGEAESSDFIQVIEYPHVGRTYLVTPAQANLQAFEVAFDEDLRVGYVAGGSDEVYEGLRNIGVQVDLLTEADLTTGDLDRYDTIMVGIYAYRTRPDLMASNARLLEWVEQGGNLLVQYHRPFDNWEPNTVPPHFLQLGRVSLESRVTDPAAPVEFLAPEHPIMTTPNQITDADFGGWTKERGLYFANEWDDAYTPLFSILDTQWPDTAPETPFTGSMLTTDLGEGRYTYTSLVLHFQLEANVPGAYRLYANLITPPDHAD
jgi:LmbE family N-acetylglucosaminyl deacetylase